MSRSTDHADLVELFGRYADLSDFTNLAGFTGSPGLVFTDPLTIDFESVAGTPPMTVPLGDYLEGLRGSFAGFVATHHAITGHVVDLDGDRARVHAHVRAEHWVPGPLAGGGPDRWLVVGFYDNEAVRTPEGWRFTRVKLTASHQEHPELARVAMAGAQLG
ncbi:nuclear transport factor 2 family protein [Amycolatopsis sp. PS_44_ISF1]|uniref:nuclear transport factor 2 family protein n=1 Tax=Amycolatopsis sp. PS_44_ISF1 TaxID=2974917 RepID=UPI0028DF1C11|nr:nuclear transport factor 2 family protein [Amycolatopsis sp. PS_44_ISF1]MDT8913985.1 nuclear transport factor 2 family protein [Amycolatopsis sp. PS_44_ISF1]